MKDSFHEYRQQLADVAQAMATFQADTLKDALHPSTTLSATRNYVETLRTKRQQALVRRLDFLADRLDSLPQFLQEYVSTQPQTGLERDLTDALEFLGWLESTGRVPTNDRDILTCQRAHLRVIANARRHQSGYRRFESLPTSQQPVSSDCLVQVNPTCHLTKFHTRSLIDFDCDTKLPADVVFFAHQGKIHAAWLEHDCVPLLHRARREPTSLADLHQSVPHVRKRVGVDLWQKFEQLGLVIFHRIRG